MKISIGADPEVFLVNKKGTFVSAHDLLPGTKDKPHKVKKGAVQVDGTAAEFNINPCFTSDEFEENINSVLGDLRKMIPAELEFKYSPTAIFKPLYFRKLPDDCKVLGCDPDYNCNTGEINPTPKPKLNTRFGGGHIHIGWTEGQNPKNPDHFWDCKMVASNLTNWFTGFIPLWDKDDTRSCVYAEGFRPKPYGVELRHFSNAWLDKPGIWKWMFETIQVGVGKLEAGIPLPDIRHYVRYYGRDPVNLRRNLESVAYAYRMPAFPFDKL